MARLGAISGLLLLAWASSVVVSAAFDGNYVQAKRLLCELKDPNSRDKEGVSALTMAAKEGHVAVAELLLRVRADAERMDSSKRTALAHATGDEKGVAVPAADM